MCFVGCKREPRRAGILFKEESYAIIGACFNVYNEAVSLGICFQKIIVELKAVSALADEHRAELLNYLHATEMKLGLLVKARDQHLDRFVAIKVLPPELLADPVLALAVLLCRSFCHAYDGAAPHYLSRPRAFPFLFAGRQPSIVFLEWRKAG